MAEQNVIARLSFWVLPKQMPKFEADYEALVVPILKRHGLTAVADCGRPTRACVFARLFALSSYADIEAKHQVLEKDSEWQRVMVCLGKTFGTGDEVFEALDMSYGSFRMVGIRRAFMLYEMPLGTGKTVIAGPGKQIPVGSGRGHWRTYNVTDGLADVEVYSIVQGEDGAMWLGTRSGISRFDGHTWSRYAIEQGLENDWVTAIFQDANGGMWVGTNKMLYYCDPTLEGEPEFVLVRKHLVIGSTKGIFQDRMGALWFNCPGTALHRYDQPQNLWTTFTVEDGLPGGTVLCSMVDGDGRIWFGTLEGEIYQFDGQAFIKWPCPDSITSPVGSIYKDSQGQIWFGTYGGGVVRYDGEKFHTYTVLEGLVHNSVIAICEDQKGHLWFGTQGGGASYFDGKTFYSYTTQNGLTNNIVLDICEDREGNMWFGTVNGVSCFMGASISSFAEQEGLGGSVVFCGAKDQKGHLWFGTETGLTHYDGYIFTTFTEQDGLGHSSVRSIFEDRTGYLWLGTYGGGVTRYDGKVFTTFRPEDGLMSTHVWSITQDTDDVMWFSTWKGRTVARFDGKVWAHFTSEDGLGDHKYCAVFADASDRIWVGANEGSGLACLDGETCIDYGHQKGLPHLALRVIFQDREGVIWVGTKGGVGRFNGTSFSPLTVQDGLSHDAVEAFFEDEAGYLWIGTVGGGVNRCDFHRSGDPVVQCLETRDGLIGDKIRVILQDESGDFWIGTNLGITRYSPNTSTAPGVVIDAVIAGERFEHSDDISISTGVKLVTFVVRGVSFKTRPEAMVYQYRLRGIDEQWRTSYEQHIEYEDVPAGDYVFEVVAIDRDMMRSTIPATMRLKVEEPPEKILLQISEAERERLDTELRELQYLYRLRDALAEPMLREDAVLKTGTLVVEALAELGPTGAVIQLDGRVWTFGQIEDLIAHECKLVWGRQDRGVLRVFCNRDLDASYKHAFVDDTADQLSRALESLELGMQVMQSSRLVSLGQMAAGVAHELNQPLSVVSTTAGDIYYRLADNRALPKSELQEMMVDMLDVVDKLESTIDHLRIFSRDTSQEPGTLFSINEVIPESLKLIETQLKNHGIDLLLDLEDHLPEVFGHPRQVEQVLLNLLTNARDAIDAQTNGNKHIDVRCLQQNNQVVVEVEDTGIGIAEEHVSRLFEPFFTTKPEDRGTGLGLSISYAIVKEHGGQISCSSVLGEGAVFRVVLPIAHS